MADNISQLVERMDTWAKARQITPDQFIGLEMVAALQRIADSLERWKNPDEDATQPLP
jgi:hypothetical protein